MTNVCKTDQVTASQGELDRLAEVASSAVAVAVRLRELDRPFAVYLAEMLVCEILEQLDDRRALELLRDCKSKGIRVSS